MIVEFIGAPGAGKTTLLPLVQEYFQAQAYRPYSVVEASRPFVKRTDLGQFLQFVRPQKLQRFLLWKAFYSLSYFHRAKFSKKHQMLLQTVFDYQTLRPLNNADYEHVLRWFLHLTGSYEFLKAYAQDDEVLLFDEGFVHRVVQLFASENEMPDYESVANYLDFVPQPDMVVYPNISYELSVKRVFERGIWKRFQAKSREETERFLKNAHSIVNYTVDYIRMKGWNVIEVNNEYESLVVPKVMLQDALLTMPTPLNI